MKKFLFSCLFFLMALAAQAQVTTVTIIGVGSGTTSQAIPVTFAVNSSGQYQTVTYDVLFSAASSPSSASYSSFLAGPMICSGADSGFFFNDQGSMANTIVQHFTVPAPTFSGNIQVIAAENQGFLTCSNTTVNKVTNTSFTIGATLTPTNTGTPTFTRTATSTPTNSPTKTPTNTPTNSPTNTPTNTPILSPTSTFTPTPGATQIIPFYSQTIGGNRYASDYYLFNPFGFDGLLASNGFLASSDSSGNTALILSSGGSVVLRSGINFNYLHLTNDGSTDLVSTNNAPLTVNSAASEKLNATTSLDITVGTNVTIQGTPGFTGAVTCLPGIATTPNVMHYQNGVLVVSTPAPNQH